VTDRAGELDLDPSESDLDLFSSGVYSVFRANCVPEASKCPGGHTRANEDAARKLVAVIADESG